MDIKSRMSHKTQKTQKHTGICVPHCGSPAGNLSSAFKHKSRWHHGKINPGTMNHLCFQRLKFPWPFPSFYCHTWCELVLFSCFLQILICKAHIRDGTSIPKDMCKWCSFRLLLPFSSPYATCPYVTQQQIYFSNPTAPSGKISVSFQTETRKCKSMGNIEIRPSFCGYLLGIPIALSGMCVYAYLKP